MKADIEDIKKAYVKKQGYYSIAEMIRKGTFNPTDADALMEWSYRSALEKIKNELYETKRRIELELLD